MLLDVGAGPNLNGRDVAAGHGLKPKRRVVADGDIAANDGIGGLIMATDALHPGVGFIGIHGRKVAIAL